MRLADPVGYSYLDLYVRFKLSEALLKRADKLQILLQLAESAGQAQRRLLRLPADRLHRPARHAVDAELPVPAAGAGFGSRAAGRAAAPLPSPTLLRSGC